MPSDDNISSTARTASELSANGPVIILLDTDYDILVAINSATGNTRHNVGNLKNVVGLIRQVSPERAEMFIRSHLK